MLKGCDISHFQGSVNWQKMAAEGIRFCYCKASQGATSRDGTWTDERRKEAAAAGVVIGGYHFADLSQSAEANAKNFLAAIGDPRPGELLPAIDVEAGGLPSGLSERDIADWLDAFATEMGKAGRATIIYTDHGTLFARLLSAELSVIFPHLWLARYTNAADPGETGETGGWSDWAIWQHSQSGTVDGINGNVDLDWIRDEDTLNALTVPSLVLDGPGN